MNMETKNARIESTMLGKEDHGMFTFYLHLDYGGSGQGAGGYCLSDKNGYVSLKIIGKILEIVGVETWEELVGKPIRVRCTNMKVYAIGNLLKDEWLDFTEFDWEDVRDDTGNKS